MRNEISVVRTLIIWLSLLTTVALGQSYDTIKLKLVAGHDVIPGASVVVKDHLPIIATVTDIDGVASVIIPSEKEFVQISFMGPYVRLKIERPTDSIYFDVNSKKAAFYHNKKRTRTKKQVVSGY